VVAQAGKRETDLAVIRAYKILQAGSWATASVIDEITLDYDRRHRRRHRFNTASGAEILLDLPEAIHIRDGDAMGLEDGTCISVRAAPEELLEITTPDAHSLTRLAWHLGNRHLAVQILPDRLRILQDHVIAEMILRLGGNVSEIAAPFDPETGAYHHE
jgi:urease accessory protein